jgi:hypothetical protein
MKRFMLLAIGLIFLFTTSAVAQVATTLSGEMKAAAEKEEA